MNRNWKLSAILLSGCLRGTVFISNKACDLFSLTPILTSDKVNKNTFEAADDETASLLAFAHDGTGTHQETIDWFEWWNHGDQIATRFTRARTPNIDGLALLAGSLKKLPLINQKNRDES